ncbi:hypothetical protein Atai01_02900 [Amycolatopsis taiwanensis]|uniref:Uncharacterized protein n=1 Tax=Amycolatopsis taiwanensis TaxID=342230 RepID=A0A9W6QTD6_9PSEU|nr:hypothetical protein Atai01_02900 [Amycolatopsis taiwanensis]
MRVPECAAEALLTVARARGVSRDEVVRQLLDEYLVVQERRAPDDRWTHISTVLRYPPAPRSRREPQAGVTLRLRLAPGVAERARTIALQLPGQSPRARRDYQARQLTDAVVTAIALQQSFTDDFLDGLLPLLRQGAALGLWHLATAATSTAAENVVLDAAQEVRWRQRRPGEEIAPEDKRLLLVAEALENDVAWHHPYRFQVATNIARHHLHGTKARQHEDMLYHQGMAWDVLRHDLRHDTESTHWANPGIEFDWSGRGGAAVWRAYRRVELQDFEEWLSTLTEANDEQCRRVRPPGWLVRVPAGWFSRVVWGQLTEPFASWVATGRVLAVPYLGRHILWPMAASPLQPGCQPVAAMGPVIAAAQGLRPDQISGFIEAVLLQWLCDDDEHHEIVGPLLVPANTAYDLGVIDAEQRKTAQAEARRQTLLDMDRLIERARNEKPDYLPYLVDARGRDSVFRRIAANAGYEFARTRANWRWPIRSVADEALTTLRPDALKWLAGWVYGRHRRMLQMAMEKAWRNAFAHHPVAWWIHHPQRDAPPQGDDLPVVWIL